MTRHLYTLTILFLLMFHNACSAQVMDSKSIIKILDKCWRSVSQEYSTIYGLEEEEVKNYAKQKVCFTPDSITMYSGVLYTPQYSIKKVNAEDYAKNNFDCSKQKIGISVDSVYEITISSLLKPAQNEPGGKMTDIIVFDGDCIYIVKDGVIFKLYDSEAKKGARGAN